MQSQDKIIIISLLFATLGIAACDDNTANNCGLSEESCQSVNKTLDAEKCICVEHLSCLLTEESCQATNQTLDVQNCICIEKTTPTACTWNLVNLSIGDKICDETGRVITCQANGTMSEGVECTKGACVDGACIRRNCGSMEDGKNICQNHKLMTCDDGNWIEDILNACDIDTQICRDNEFSCSAYKDCGNIEHGKIGCKDNNIVSCNDGEISLIEGGNCIAEEKYCIADESTESGFICKSPDPTDCAWKDGMIAKGQNVCEGNIFKTCSAEKDGEFNDGFDCATREDDKIFCDPKLNICRAYYSCGDNDEIAHDSIACNAKGTNKAQCRDGKLVDLTGDAACPDIENATSVCIFDTAPECSFVCKSNYSLVENACQLTANCDPVKEIYQAETNTCTCNDAAHWTGTASACTCKPGYLQIGNTCVEESPCPNAHNVLDKTTNTCVCDIENHWIGKAASCQCEDGFVQIEGQCAEVVSCSLTHTVWDKSTNTCVCDAAGHWSKIEEICACNDGYVEVSGECQISRTCDINREKYDEATNTCACDTDKFWTGTAGNCTCAAGYVQVGNICEKKAVCKSAGQIYIENANICGCDASKNWIQKDNKCVCPDGMILLDGACLYLKKGSTFNFGRYEQDNDTTNGKEPISWLVLDKTDDDKYLVISEKIIDARPYNVSQSVVNWDNSTIRSWLNNYCPAANIDWINYCLGTGFDDMAFTHAEGKKVIRTHVVVEENSKCSNCEPEAETDDQFFILSPAEVEKYLPNESDRLAEVTKYAIAQGVQVRARGKTPVADSPCNAEHCYAEWWLRTPAYINTYKSSVDILGRISELKINAADTGVRPSFWIDLK